MVSIYSNLLGSCYVRANRSRSEWQHADRWPGARQSTKPHHCQSCKARHEEIVPVTPSTSVCARHGCPSSLLWEALFHGKVSHGKGQGTAASAGAGRTALLSVTTESLQDTCLGTWTRKTWMLVRMRPSALTTGHVATAGLLASFLVNNCCGFLFPSIPSAKTGLKRWRQSLLTPWMRAESETWEGRTHLHPSC